LSPGSVTASRISWLVTIVSMSATVSDESLHALQFNTERRVLDLHRAVGEAAVIAAEGGARRAALQRDAHPRRQVDAVDRIGTRRHLARIEEAGDVVRRLRSEMLDCVDAVSTNCAPVVSVFAIGACDPYCWITS